MPLKSRKNLSTLPRYSARPRRKAWAVWSIPLLAVAALAIWVTYPNASPSSGSVRAEQIPVSYDTMQIGEDPTRTASHEVSELKDRLQEDGFSRLRSRMAEVDAAGQPDELSILAEEVETSKIPSILGRLNEQELGTELSAILARRWAEVNPSAAGKWVAQLPFSDSRTTLLVAVASVWLKRDKEAVFSWMMELPSHEEQVSVAMRLDHDRSPPPWVALDSDGATVVSSGFRDLVRRDVSGAAEWVGTLPDGSEREAAIEYLAGTWAYQDPGAAIAWVHKLTEENERKKGFVALVSHLPIACSGAVVGNPSHHVTDR